MLEALKSTRTWHIRGRIFILYKAISFSPESFQNVFCGPQEKNHSLLRTDFNSIHLLHDHPREDDLIYQKHNEKSKGSFSYAMIQDLWEKNLTIYLIPQIIYFRADYFGVDKGEFIGFCQSRIRTQIPI